jgi:aminoglycoside 6'-N-acetyltransferase I
MPPTLKRLSAEDVEVLHNVAEDIFDHAIEMETAKRFLAAPHNLLIVALDGDRVVAQLAAVLMQHVDAPPDLFIDNLGVAAAWRRRGLARRMLAMAFEAGAAQGAAAAWVGADTDNAPANALYTNTGAAAERFLMFSYASLDGLGRDDETP